MKMTKLSVQNFWMIKKQLQVPKTMNMSLLNYSMNSFGKPGDWVTPGGAHRRADTHAWPNLSDPLRGPVHNRRLMSCDIQSPKIGRRPFGLFQWLSSSQLWLLYLIASRSGTFCPADKRRTIPCLGSGGMISLQTADYIVSLFNLLESYQARKDADAWTFWRQRWLFVLFTLSLFTF